MTYILLDINDTIADDDITTVVSVIKHFEDKSVFVVRSQTRA